MKTEKIKQRKRHYFDSAKEIEWLKFLEDDKTRFKRFILKNILLAWDREISYIRPRLYKNKKILDLY